jgi:hypothetical protein
MRTSSSSAGGEDGKNLLSLKVTTARDSVTKTKARTAMKSIAQPVAIKSVEEIVVARRAFPWIYGETDNGNSAELRLSRTASLPPESDIRRVENSNSWSRGGTAPRPKRRPHNAPLHQVL